MRLVIVSDPAIFITESHTSQKVTQFCECGGEPNEAIFIQIDASARSLAYRIALGQSPGIRFKTGLPEREGHIGRPPARAAEPSRSRRAFEAMFQADRESTLK